MRPMVRGRRDVTCLSMIAIGGSAARIAQKKQGEFRRVMESNQGDVYIQAEEGQNRPIAKGPCMLLESPKNIVRGLSLALHSPG